MTEVQTQSSVGPPPEKKQKAEIDCQQCGLVKSKYTCPKCSFRTCSLPCVKLHKEANECDGQRKPFESVKKFSQFDDNVSVKDQGFLSSLASAVSGGIRSTNNIVKLAKQEDSVVNNAGRKRAYPEESPIAQLLDSIETQPNEMSFDSKTSFESKTEQETSMAESVQSEEVEENEFLRKHGNGPSDPNSLTHVEKYLISNAGRRRVFLSVDSPAGKILELCNCK